MNDPKCINCAYSGDYIVDEKKTVLVCRYSPPKFRGQGKGVGAKWPIVSSRNDWCGKFATQFPFHSEDKDEQ